MTTLVSSWAATSSPGIPLCPKVESPMTEQTGKAPACAAPSAMPTLAPMHTQLWIARRGGSAPSV